MKAKRIKRYLIVAILTLSVTPLIASYWLLQEVLNSAVGLAVKPQTGQLLEHYRDDLKHLRQLDPANEATYKKQFMAVSDELTVYQQPQLLRQVLTDTYLTYYLLLFVAFLLLALLVAVWLSRRVARAYKDLALQDIAKAQKIQALSHFDQWQVIAAKLAHEINNPLTPIEMMVTNLPRSYQTLDSDDFKHLLTDTELVVSEEVHKLKAMVSHFSRFSKLPEPLLTLHNLREQLEQFVRLQHNHWPQVELTLTFDSSEPSSETVLLDHLLFNQCLVNLINNAVQANPELKPMSVDISLMTNEQDVAISVFNQGKSIEPQHCESIFDLYYSTKADKENMGLGLCIVRKIMLDHGGDIRCEPHHEGAEFVLTLPTARS